MGTIATTAGMFLPPHYLPPSAWTGHLPFASWIVEQCAPRILVELGTHAGASYMGFCQAVRDLGLPTQCHAVDTWLGDEHAGLYDDNVYETLKSDHDKEYAGFSRLMRMTFDDALQYFADGSVDLLHIDGLHTYDAVRHDFESWAPKLSPNAVVLFHDIAERERGLGVWRLWEQVSASFPAFSFTHSHGLGVLMVGSEVPEPLISLARNQEQVVEIRRLFESLGRLVESEQARAHFERMVVIRDREWAHEAATRAATEVECEAIRQQLAAMTVERDDSTLVIERINVAVEQSLRDTVEQLGDITGARDEAADTAQVLQEAHHLIPGQVANLISSLDSARARIVEVETESVHLRAEAEALQVELGCLRIERCDLYKQNMLMLGSRSWRLTAPLRAVMHALTGRQ